MFDLSPPVKYFTDRSKAVLLLWIFYVFVLSCVCYVFGRVCLYVLCGHLLGKDWPLGSRLWCQLWVCHFPIGILGQVWYLIVSIPDLCTLTYFDSLRPINNLSVMQGRFFLGWTSTKIGIMCHAQGHNAVTRHEARTGGLSVSSHALYHWATALSNYWTRLLFVPQCITSVSHCLVCAHVRENTPWAFRTSRLHCSFRTYAQPCNNFLIAPACMCTLHIGRYLM